MDLTVGYLEKLFNNSRETLKKVRQLEENVQERGKFTLLQRYELSRLVTQSRLLHSSAADAYYGLIKDESGLTRLLKQHSVYKRTIPTPFTMLNEIIENHQWLGKHLNKQKFKGKPFLEYLPYAKGAFEPKGAKIKPGFALRGI